MAMKISDKLIARLNDEFNLGIPSDEKPRRLYQGYNARSSGAWSWAIGGTETFGRSYGSQFTMKELLKSKYITTFIESGNADISILPVGEKEYLEWQKSGRKGANDKKNVNAIIKPNNTLSGRLTNKKLVQWVNKKFIEMEITEYEVVSAESTRFSGHDYEGGARKISIRFQEKKNKNNVGEMSCFYSLKELERYLNVGYELYLRADAKEISLTNLTVDVRN